MVRRTICAEGLVMVVGISLPWARQAEGQSMAEPIQATANNMSRTAKIFGADDRLVVPDASAFPWSTVGMIRASWGAGNIWLGTGVMICDRSVLTCAHTVYDTQAGQAETIYFIPIKNGASEPYGWVQVTECSVLPQWSASGDDQYDLAVLGLSSAVGRQTGHMTIVAEPASFFFERTLNSAGYPVDLNADSSMYYESGVVSKPDGNLVLHQLDATPGQSGSPMWDYDARLGTRVLVALMSGTRTTTNAQGGGEIWNVGIRITDQHVQWINGILAQHDPGCVISTLPPDTGKPDPGVGSPPYCGAGTPGGGVLGLLAMAGWGILSRRVDPG